MIRSETIPEDPAPLPCASKLVFDTQAQAAGSAVVVRHRYGTQVRPYRCKYCQLWHLASAHN